MFSINTNTGAMVALSNMRRINAEMEQVQRRISTGLRVSSARDDGAAFAIAQGLRGDIKAYETVNQQLNMAKGTVAVGIEAATQISNTMNDLRSVVLKLADENVTGDARTQYEADYRALQEEMVNYYSNANFNGRNLLQTASTDINVIANIDASAITLQAQDLQSGIDALATVPMDAASARAMLNGGGAFETADAAVDMALNGLAANDRRLDRQISFNQSMSDTTEASLGAIVDADLAKESARLQALQVKQQLAIQALSMAARAPQMILSLFR
ncbi:MAG: flagellin [Alphaproteobacteria bacterium]